MTAEMTDEIGLDVRLAKITFLSGQIHDSIVVLIKANIYIGPDFRKWGQGQGHFVWKISKSITI